MTHTRRDTENCLYSEAIRLRFGSLLRCMLACLLILGWQALPARAGEAIAAVATNFMPTFNELVRVFEGRSLHEIVSVPGSTGKIYAQIKNGAPFDIFLSADALRPQILEVENAVVANSRFVYAEGRLALWSLDESLFSEGWERALGRASVKRVAIANPNLAPYGSAALEVVRNLGLETYLKSKIVYGDSVGQAYAHVATGNAELGIVPLSYVQSPFQRVRGVHQAIPESLHSPIKQEAVLLNKAHGNPAALAFHEFLRSSDARLVIEEFGYNTFHSDD